MLENLTFKQKIIFYIILSIMILFIIYYIYTNLSNNNFTYIDDNSIFDNEIETETSDNTIEFNSSSNFIIVYVCGCVKEPKNVSLIEGSRVSDAINAVGGLNENADLNSINLAQVLEDGEKIYIPEKGEEFINNNISSISDKTFSQKININKATQIQLEAIPGIGPSTALKIIEFRNKNGKFNSIEDIKNISGIGEAKFEKIKDYICIK